MANCSNTLTTLAASCAATKKRGGYDKRFWIGSIEDLAAATGVTYGTAQEVTALAFDTGKGLISYTGKRLKHSSTGSIEKGENTKLRMQSFTAILYAQTGAERLSIEQLIDAEDVFVLAESNSGSIEVFGINKGDNSVFDNYGLDCETVEDRNGALLNDDTSIALTFTGQLENLPLVFSEGSTLAANIVTLDSYIV
jgi:hypothetical protein